MISGCLRWCHIYLWNRRLQLHHISPGHLLDIHREVYECTPGDEMSQPLPFWRWKVTPLATTHHTPENRDFIFDQMEAVEALCSIKSSLVGDDIHWDFCKVLDVVIWLSSSHHVCQERKSNQVSKHVCHWNSVAPRGGGSLFLKTIIQLDAMSSSIFMS